MGEQNAVAARFETSLDDFVAAAWVQVRERVPADCAALDWDVLEAPLRADLSARLTRLARPTLVLELNVARLEERLRGDTPEERFRYYVDVLLRDPAQWRTLSAEYGVLAELLHETAQRWVDATTELATRLRADFASLRGDLLPADARLTGLVASESDAHRGGRVVRILEFGDARIVYKPRPLAVDVAFQELLAFCNTGIEPALPLLRVLDRGEYGWTEFVSRSDCADTAAVQRFYRRQGAYLALLHVIDGVDMHHENLIAAGEHPVLVDLETLFDRYVSDEVVGADAFSVATVGLRDSVQRTGLLPGRMWGDDRHPGINIGGLGSGAAQLTPTGTATWDEAGTDTMHQVLRRVEIPAAANVPRVDGVPQPVYDHTEALVDGFTSTLRFLAQADVPVRAFAEVPVRQVVRATATYAHLLGVARHPDRLRDPRDRDALFDSLRQVSTGPLARVLDAELADLRAHDVPAFRARPDSRDLWDSRDAVIPDFFETTAVDQVSARLAALDSGAVAAQEFIVRAALSATELSPARPLAAAGSALDCAGAIGEMLLDTAISGTRDVTWLGLQVIGDQDAYQLAPLGPDLYSGTSGIALFLAHLGAATGDLRFTDLAARAVGVREAQPSGGFVGVPSQLYALAHLAALWGDVSLVPLELLDQVADGVPDSEFDVVYGSAGTILALLAVHEATGSERALAIAVDHGRHLAEHAVFDDMTLGFAHGVEGVGYALSRLAAKLGHVQFADRALEVFRHVDLRRAEVTKTSWCHGTTGFALSRGTESLVDTARPRTDGLCHGELGLLTVVDDPALVADRLAAVLAGPRTGFAHPESAPSLMFGTSGIGFGLLRLARPDVVPQVLALAPPTPAAPRGRTR